MSCNCCQSCSCGSSCGCCSGGACCCSDERGSGRPALLGLLGALVASLGLWGCAGGSSSATASGGEAGAVTHQASEADRASTHGSSPVQGPYVRLAVNGMGCPQCVTNVDEQLERQLGAKDVRVNLESGIVTARFDRVPTPDQLNKAIDDAGLTLVKVEASPTPLGS